MQPLGPAEFTLPISSPEVFTIVLLWNAPESVREHLITRPMSSKLMVMGDQIIRKSNSLTLSLLADAVLTAVASMSAAISAASMSLLRLRMMVL